MDMIKVYYNQTTKAIVHTIDVDHTANFSSLLPFVVCDETLLEDVVSTRTTVAPTATPGEFVEVTTNYMSGKKFPMTDLVSLKRIAGQTIDHWRQAQQGAGYAHTTGVTYGSDDRTRSLLVGKIQEMQVLSTASGIFPDIGGVPVMHTLAEMEAVGLGMAAQVEATYLQAVGLTQQVMDPAVIDLAGIEAILAPVLGA